MGLRDELTADIAEAFGDDLADAVSSFTGSRDSDESYYDPVTEVTIPVLTTYTGRGVFGAFDLRVVDGISVLRTDVKLTALQSEVTATPKIDDKITQGATTYTVIQVGKDPSGSTWSLQIRST